MAQQCETPMLELQQRIALLEARELATQKYLAQQAQQLTAAQAKVSLLTTIAQVTHLLLKADSYTSVLPEVVRLLGEAVGSDRCRIGQGISHPVTGKPALRIAPEWEWCKTKVLPSEYFSIHGNLLFLWEDAPYINAQLLQGKVVNCLVADLPEPDRSLLAAQGSTAELFVPIFVNQQRWGFICFDNCCEARVYDAAEIAILQIAADSIAAAIARQAKDDELRESERRYRTLFELSSEGIMRLGYNPPILIALSVDEQLDLCYQSVYVAEGNNAFAQMYEYASSDDLIGLPMKDFHDRNSEVTQATMLAWIENCYACRQLETVKLDRHGRKRYFLNSSVSTSKHECVTSTWVSQVDITELREVQQALLQAEQARSQELERLNTQLQERDRLLSVVAQITTDLLAAEEIDSAIPKALQAVGEASAMSRVQLILERQNPITQCLQHHVTYEWVADGILAQIDHPELAVIDNEDVKEILTELYQGQSFWRLVEELPAGIREQFQSIGIQSTGTVSIFIEGRYVGVVAFDDCMTLRQWSQHEIDVLTAASESIGAALHRKQLIDRLIEERARAAEERALELQKTNEALQRMIARLATNPDLDAYLGHVLIEAAEQVGAHSNALFAYDEASNTLRMRLITFGGAIADIQTDPRLEMWRDSIPADISPGWNVIVGETGFLLHDVNTSDPHAWQFALPWHSQMGHVSVMCVPLRIGDRAIGFMRLCFRDRAELAAEKIALARALADQATLALELTRLADEAKQEAEQAAVLEERNRMAREIHDTLAQSFTGISLQVKAAKLMATSQPDTAWNIIDRVHELAQAGLAEARRSVWALHPDAAEYSEFLTTLERSLQDLTANTAIETTLQVEGTPYSLPCDLGRNLLRVAQEAITNCLRHAQASTIAITMQFNADSIQLEIQDNGCGFDPVRELDRGGFGLLGMQQRCQRIGGRFAIASESGLGTCLTINIPIGARVA